METWLRKQAGRKGLTNGYHFSSNSSDIPKNNRNIVFNEKNRNKRRKGNNIDLVSLPTNCKKWGLIKKVNFFKFRAIVEERIQTDPLL